MFILKQNLLRPASRTLHCYLILVKRFRKKSKSKVLNLLNFIFLNSVLTLGDNIKISKIIEQFVKSLILSPLNRSILMVTSYR